jgi:hypothetical protein
MSVSTRQHIIVTSHGSLAVEESGQGGIPVLLIQCVSPVLWVRSWPLSNCAVKIGNLAISGKQISRR